MLCGICKFMIWFQHLQFWNWSCSGLGNKSWVWLFCAGSMFSSFPIWSRQTLLSMHARKILLAQRRVVSFMLCSAKRVPRWQGWYLHASSKLQLTYPQWLQHRYWWYGGRQKDHEIHHRADQDTQNECSWRCIQWSPQRKSLWWTMLQVVLRDILGLICSSYESRKSSYLQPRSRRYRYLGKWTY